MPGLSISLGLGHSPRNAGLIAINDNFASGIGGWVNPSGKWSAVNGQAVMASSSDYEPLRKDTALQAGVAYRLTFDLVAVTGTLGITTNMGAGFLGTFDTTGTKTLDFTATHRDFGFSRAAAGTTCTIDNVLVVRT